jgi:F-type H+-transporting ATPase subunit b
MSYLSPLARLACETPRKLALALVLATMLLSLPRGVAAQAPHAEPAGAAEAKPGAEEHGTAGEAEGEHGSDVVGMIARLVNFAILAGTLVYLLRSPFAGYLADRSSQIRSDLVNAAEMKQAAAAQIADIDRKMKALPGELEALRAQGAQEIAAEEARIRSAAAAERDRLLEQARRDIDMQVKIAERSLVSHAADLAVGVATERIKNNITDDDQKRLVDRYVQQLKS